MKKTLLASLTVLAVTPTAGTALDLNIATVDNSHMITMQELAPEFEAANPDIKLNWITLEEDVMRERITKDIAKKGGQFDIMTIGMYEAPIWGEKGWLHELSPDDVDDILPAIRSGLSHNDKLYASPFFGESSMIMYRKDLVAAAGMEITDNPNWGHISDVAAAIHRPDDGIYGICLRGKPGWADNVALITTVANSFGARWFDEDWQPQLQSPEWHAAVQFYIDLLNNYGPPDSTANSYNELLALYNEGKCGMWIDTTVAASSITDPETSKVHDKVAFAQSPIAVTQRGVNWLWAWALGVPAGTHKADAAKTFINWATSKEYIELVAEKKGWGSVPTGTRESTYVNPEFRAVASFAEAEMTAIKSADPENSTFKPSPYIGVQFASIPEFQVIGVVASQQLSAALAGNTSVPEALEAIQRVADDEMRKAGYY